MFVSSELGKMGRLLPNTTKGWMPTKGLRRQCWAWSTSPHCLRAERRRCPELRRLGRRQEGGTPEARSKKAVSPPSLPGSGARTPMGKPRPKSPASVSSLKSPTSRQPPTRQPSSNKNHPHHQNSTNLTTKKCRQQKRRPHCFLASRLRCPSLLSPA